MSLRADWHYVATVDIYTGGTLAFTAGARVPDGHVDSGLIPASAVRYDPTGGESTNLPAAPSASPAVGWHYVARVFICWGQAVAFAPGDRVPDEFVRTGLVPLSAVTFDPSDSPSWDSISARTWDSLLCTWGIGLGGQANQPSRPVV